MAPKKSTKHPGGKSNATTSKKKTKGTTLDEEVKKDVPKRPSRAKKPVARYEDEVCTILLFTRVNFAFEIDNNISPISFTILFLILFSILVFMLYAILITISILHFNVILLVILISVFCIAAC